MTIAHGILGVSQKEKMCNLLFKFYPPHCHLNFRENSFAKMGKKKIRMKHREKRYKASYQAVWNTACTKVKKYIFDHSNK